MADESRFDLTGTRVFVAGHRGMVGSALVRRLAREDCEVVTAGRDTLDLTRQADIEDWLAAERPDVVFLAAARVGGIAANDARPADFLYDNLAIEMNVIHGAWKAGVAKLVFLGSSCIYPKHAAQPIAEDALLTGPLEPTNAWYAVAKIAGIKMCDAYRRQHGADFISVMPTNLYGPGDNYDLETSHVAAALLIKAHRARQAGASEIEIWGTGTPLREFMHVDDLADALVFLARRFSEAGPINAGSGHEISILDLAELVTDVVGWRGRFVFDRARPDGTPRKLMDSSRLNAMGWHPQIGLREGLSQTYEWLKEARSRSAAA